VASAGNNFLYHSPAQRANGNTAFPALEPQFLAVCQENGVKSRAGVGNFARLSYIKISAMKTGPVLIIHPPTSTRE
jgi:hypothetical protein